MSSKRKKISSTAKMRKTLRSAAALSISSANRTAMNVAEAQQRLQCNPADVDAYLFLAELWQASQRHDEVVILLQAALQHCSAHAALYGTLAHSVYQQGDAAAALALLDQAASLAANDSSWLERCQALALQRQDWPMLEQCCLAYLHYWPEGTVADTMHGLLGALLLQRSAALAPKALWHLQRAVTTLYADPAVQANLCAAFLETGDTVAAIKAGQQACQLEPPSATAYNNLGLALRAQGFHAQSHQCFLQSLALDNDPPETHYNLSCVCMEMGELLSARQAAVEAVMQAQRPAWLLHAAHLSRQLAEWALAESLEQLFFQQLPVMAPLLSAFDDLTAEDSVLCTGRERMSPFALICTPGSTAAQQQWVARQLAASFVTTSAAAPVNRSTEVVTQRPVAGAVTRGLRLGIVSSDFYDHATAHLITGVLEQLHQHRIEWIAYDIGVREHASDPYRERLQRAASDWVDLRYFSDHQAADKIRTDAPDMVIDLKGWTQGYRAGILAEKPAALQLQWLGFPGGMGAPWIDYIIADAVVIPPAAARFYDEKIVYLAHCYQPHDTARLMATPPSRAALEFTDDDCILAAFHQSYKITRQLWQQWMAILHQLPQARLWLLTVPDTVRRVWEEAARDAGVDPGRLCWAPRLPVAEHLARLSLADIALDTFPVNAHTTASDALWAGVPLVAWCGETFVSRVSASILQAAGLAEWVASSADDYQTRIIQLGRSASCRAALRQQLQHAREHAPLFDTALFTRDLATKLLALHHARR